jgi:hypothetical protein
VTLFKILLRFGKPIALFLAEQEKVISTLFQGFQINYEGLEITPSSIIRDVSIKMISHSGHFIPIIDKPNNLMKYTEPEIPFIFLGDGEMLMRAAASMEGRKVEEINLNPKKRRRGFGFGDDDDDDDDFLFGSKKDRDRDDIFGKDKDDDLPIKFDKDGGLTISRSKDKKTTDDKDKNGELNGT